MKKTAILLVLALLLTALIPYAAVSVVAAEPSETLDTNFYAYEYATDDAAIADGAIAKFTRTTDSKVFYLKDLPAVFRFGGDAEKGAATIDLIADVTLASATVGNIGSRSFTLNGNGHKITDSGLTSGVALSIIGSTASAVVTLHDLLFRLPTTSNVQTLSVGTNNSSTPVTVVLSQVDLLAVTVSHEVVAIRNDSKLILEDGTKIKTEQNNPWNSNGGSVAVIMTANAKLETRNGSSILSKGPAIYSFTNATGTEITINGGSVRSTGVSALTTGSGAVNTIVVNGGEIISSNTACITTTATTSVTVTGGVITNTAGSNALNTVGTATISGGSFTSANGDAIVSTGTTTISGGNILGSSGMTISGGTTTISGGEFRAKTYAAVCATSGGKAIINGGYFTTATPETTLQYGFGVITSGNGAARTGGNVTINGGTFAYKNRILFSNTSSDGTGIINVYGGEFIGNKTVFNGNGDGHTGAISLDSLPQVQTGAAVRTVPASAGIRFTSTIAKSVLDTAESLKKAGTTVQYGTVIAPAEYVTAAGVFTKEALLRADLAAAANKRFVDIPAVNGIETDANGNVTFHAALVDLAAANYARDLAAVAYLSYETENGTVTIYADFNATNNVRNIRAVAYGALADVVEVREAGYETLVNEWYTYTDGQWVKQTGIRFSCYSAAQLDLIRGYLPE